MVVEFLILDDDDKEFWRDLYIDEKLIQGFYLPTDSNDSINVLYARDFMTFKRTVSLVRYLENRFILC